MTSPQDPHTKVYSHINGGIGDLIDRLAVAELCKGWPMYRDASEWKNLRSLFFDDVTIWMTWSGPRSVDEFIGLSKEGKANSVFIMHCECRTLIELSPRYRFLRAAQARLGYKIDTQLPTASNELWGTMYAAMEEWLDVGKTDLFWEKSN
ncbi:hypothetical protein B0J13DRAFT_664936 [Dactylonectria estremocensis]|uniref:SnoaL-like domain-containing protein n=1 Tax=Dactylonectria estremocensis TaxID=1079267 RepID=A0A9P9J4Q0_9HYPO|nr:hypothetical protein B0J13DRAFT_664936 [Dactylonectria estremocensis]